jgi:hypothetical protein
MTTRTLGLLGSATCTLSLHGRSVEGTCAQGSDGHETLAYLPPLPLEAVHKSQTWVAITPASPW